MAISHGDFFVKDNVNIHLVRSSELHSDDM